ANRKSKIENRKVPLLAPRRRRPLPRGIPIHGRVVRHRANRHALSVPFAPWNILAPSVYHESAARLAGGFVSSLRVCVPHQAAGCSLHLRRHRSAPLDSAVEGRGHLLGALRGSVRWRGPCAERRDGRLVLVLLLPSSDGKWNQAASGARILSARFRALRAC